MVTVTITASDPDTVAATLRALQAVPSVEVAPPAEQQDQVGNVVQLAAHRREATS